MKKIVVVIFLIIYGSVGVANGSDLDRNKYAEELLLSMKMDRVMETMFNGIRKQMDLQVRKNGIKDKHIPVMDEHSKELVRIMEETIGWDAQKNEIMTIYSEAFSSEELKDMLVFFKSPTGAKYIDKMPELINKSTAASQSKMQLFQLKVKNLNQETSMKLREMDN